ncbi:MAG: hypothetical protein V2B20_27380 [Pseudomonadota bacterium]
MGIHYYHYRKSFFSRRVVFYTLLCLLCSPAISYSIDENNLEAYIEKHANGWIDWKNGMIYGVGRAYLSKNRNNRPLSQGTASVVASGNIVKLASGLHLDDKATLESVGQGKVSINLNAFVRDREYQSTYVENNGDPYYEVTKVADMKGISGLTAKFLNYLSENPVWKELPIRSLEPRADLNDDHGPWLLVDARNLQFGQKVQPAIFPKILSQEGEMIYSVRSVEEEALIKRGMVSYVTTDISGIDLRAGDGRRIDELLDRVGMVFGVRLAAATTIERSIPNIPIPGKTADVKIERQRRGKYIIVDAQNVEGLAKTNLLVSVEDAKALQAEDASSQILKKCRVIVIVSSPVGGAEGSLPIMLAGRPSIYGLEQ